MPSHSFKNGKTLGHFFEPLYLGRPSGMKGDTFMCKSFVVFYSDTALFDEAMYPSCGSVRPKRTTCIDEPPSNQPDLSDDITIPDDSDDPPPEPKQERCTPQPDGVEEVPLQEPNEQQALPDDPELVPKPDELPALPRHSGRVRRHLTHPDNVYGDKHPTEITKDIEQTCNWKCLVGDQPGSSCQHLRCNQPVPGDIPEPDNAEPPIAPSDSPSNSEDEVDQLVLTWLAQEG